MQKKQVENILKKADKLRWELGDNYHDYLSESIYADAADIAGKAVHQSGSRAIFDIEQKIDRIVTSKTWGFPIMLLILSVVLWLTITGANYPSEILADFFMGWLYPIIKTGAVSLNFPWWLSGFLIDGVYLSVAWVVSVMLPPMAIFFPLFTLLEDFGYLPRVAFNLDKIFKISGAHGKQALTMTMGFGCNAAGVIAARIIDSPRERLIAIITNNFSLCNGRWGTQILLGTIFLGAVVPSQFKGLVATSSVIFIALLGIAFMFASSWLLYRTMLRGEVSTFTLELPPYRPPQFWKTLYTSLIDRTLIVLWRAVLFAAPAGAMIWLISNINIGGESIAFWTIDWLNPLGLAIGLNGVILLAYILAIPANEIVIPTILMLTVLVTSSLAGTGEGAGVMFEGSDAEIGTILRAGGWTLLTAVNVMLFSLLHNPCSTTIYTIYKETKSAKWTTVASLLPVILGLVVCGLVTFIWNLF